MANETMPYDQNHRIVPLLFVTVIVGKGQGEAIANLMKKGGAYGVYFVHGQGTAPNDIYAILGSGTLDKDVLVTVLREDAWPELKEHLEERFALSELSAGVAFAVRLDSLAGVSIYKMLSNTRHFEHPVNKFSSRRKKK